MPVSYTEALQGAENSTPTYSPQQEVYAGMMADLETAVGMFSSGGGSFGNGDILYDNDWDAWTRFANSLRMRLAMRLQAVDAGTAQSEFVAAYNAGGFTSNDENAMLAYPGSPYENPLYENWLGRDDNGISATMVDTLQSLGDPRLELYAEPASHDGVYRGHANGRDDLPEGQSLAWFSRINDFWRADGASTPTMLMTYAEVLFLQAEAAERGWIAGDAGTLYEEGIAASMELYAPWGHAPAEADMTAYLSQPRVQYSSGTGLEQIGLQKWIALWMNGSEAWAEWRRTGIPDLQMGPDVIISRIPVRFAYPDSELSLNEANLLTAVERQGGGRDLTSPVWWDVEP
ncbi:MAG: SusD/RagB family nutrient-binding outer membrane lipoprotein [Gemmatimonadota bacterium]